MSVRRTDRDRPRPGANQFGAGSPDTLQGAGDVSIMTEPVAGPTAGSDAPNAPVGGAG